MIGENQSWLTIALSDAEAWQSLVLLKSLKRNFTSRRVSILVSEDVSLQMRYVLRKQFDLVGLIESYHSDLNKNGPISGAISKSWCWNIGVWDKCVFLESNSIALQNMDDLFTRNELSAIPSEKAKTKFTTSVFVYKPNADTFEDLLQLTKKFKNEDELLNAHYNDWSVCIDKQLDASYSVAADEIHLANDSINPKSLRFTKSPWRLSAKDLKNEKLNQYYEVWEEIYYQDVLPIVSEQKKTIVQNFLLESIKSNSLPQPKASLSNGIKDVEASNLSLPVRDSIAIIGMSCRFPGADSPEEFWNTLADSVELIQSFPSERHRKAYRAKEHEKPDIHAGFLKCQVDEFDNKFFGISPREAPFIDPQQRILLEVTWESLENAGINPQSLKESDTGVFMGIWQQEYDRILPDYGITANDFHHRYLGNAFSATASRISYFLGLNGPNLALESGCSSSLGGMHLACESLRKGDISLAISSGVNLVLTVENPLSSESESFIISPTNRCHTFDESADGFVRAEGCAVVILKRFADAYRDGDNILAVIRGSALNNDGAGTSFGTPNAKSQERVIREALQASHVQPKDVSFIEAHGTGTAVGDPTEMYALSQVYSEGREKPLIVSSVKTNIGHAESAAGIAGVVKVLLCLQKQVIPPHLGLKTLNPRIDLDAIPAIIPMEMTPWKGANRIAAVSSFGMSGTNVHMLIQEAPVLPNRAPNKHSSVPKQQIVTLSTKSEEAMTEMCKMMSEYLNEHPDVSLEDVAYLTNTGRAHLPFRVAAVAKDTKQLASVLQKRAFTTGRIPAQKNKIGFLFTGQGSQYIGMAKTLYNTSPVFRVALDECDSLFQDQIGYSLYDVIWNEKKLLDQTIFCQPAIFCIQYALVQLWKSFGIQPDYVLGHSVGEFGAAVCAGVMELEDAMKLVVERSRLVNSLKHGSMMALKTAKNNVTSLINKFQQLHKNTWVDLAAVNSPEEIVVSSTEETITLFAEFCANNAVKTQTIPASHAFHSRDMLPVLEKFGQIASSITYQEPNCTFISGTIAKIMETDDFNSEYWQQHLRDTVRFADAIQVMWNDCKILIEIGPQPILLGLAMANTGDVSGGFYCPSLRKTEDDWQAVLTTLCKLYVAGVEIDWKNAYGTRKKNLILPNYPFQRQKHWYVDEEGASTSAGVNLTTKLLHPLLGRQLPSAISDSIFSHSLKLKELSYIEDHKVADRIIIPATAFLETVLAAGREVLQCGSVHVPLCVEQLTIEAALELNGPCQIQTIVHTMKDQDEVKYNVSIHRQVVAEQADKWKRHASGTFVPCIQLPVTELIEVEQVKSRLVVRDAIDTAYQKIAEAGIAFGPRFQSIAAAWTGPQEVLTQVNLPEGSEKYICHPIVLDAMIQTFAFKSLLNSNDPEITKELQLPLSVRKFLWLSRPPTSTLYVHTKWNSAPDGGANESSVILFSEDGEQLAIMEGIELIRTSVDMFLRILNADTINLPDFYQDYWRIKMGVTSSRVNVDNLAVVTTESSYTAECYAKDTYREKHIGTEEIMHKMCIIYILKAVRECGWFWKVGEPISKEEWVEYSTPKLPMGKIINAWVELLIQDGQLTKDLVALKVLPSVDDCDKMIHDLSELNNNINKDDDPAVLFVKRCGQHLTAICQSKISSLSVLFPEDSNEVGASRFYNDSLWYRVFNTMSAAVIADILTPLSGKGHGVVRILEVGAGTGATTAEVMGKLTDLEVYHQYEFTDISPVFLAEASKKFNSPSMSCKVLNIEEDPLSQGFIPYSYDLIVSTMVIHATKDIAQAILHLRALLRDGGLVVITDLFETMTHLTLTFGLLEGWWRFEDFRTVSPIVSEVNWMRLFRDCGFEHVHTIPLHGNISGTLVARAVPFKIPATIASRITWLLFDNRTDLAVKLAQKLEYCNRNVVRIFVDGVDDEMQQPSSTEYIVNPKQPGHIKTIFEAVIGKGIEGIIYFIPELTTEVIPVHEVQEQIVRGVLNLSQTIMEFGQYMKPKPRILEIAKGVHYIGDTRAGNPNAASAWGLLKSFSNENHDLPICLLDLDQNQNEICGDSLDEVISLMWVRDGEPFVALRDGKKYVARFNYMDKPAAPLTLPNSDRYVFINPPSGSFADIQFGPATRTEVGPKDLEVAVQSCALNFKDLFVIMKPEGFVLPAHQKANVGIDVSGIVTAVGPEVTKFKVGDEIYGCTMDGGLQSHIVIEDYLAMKKSTNWTFSDAATMPTVFLTAYYALVYIGKLKKDDRVLIHVASGGVGLAAIQICRYFGAEMYTTAGSNRKRDYLRSLGLPYVYHSRNTSYGECIRRDTGGKGVTLVLNSLTGPNFKETTLDNCAKGARFIEIAKINIWQPEEVQVLRPDVEYTIVDLGDLLCEEGGHEARKLVTLMNESFDTGIFTPLPHTVFALEQAKEAFHHFQEAKHIGKIVINMPKPITSPQGKLSLVHQMFNKYCTYLVTGGLGGLGMEVARWMISSGAEHVVLCGRNPPNPKCQELIDSWNVGGVAKVLAFQTDVGEYDQCVSLLQKIKDLELPPLRGIFHAAGVLSDATIPNQTWDKFNTVFRPKVYGGWYLHSLTQGYELDMFVMFSSMACIHGMLGQSNHSAANRYLDSLTHYRLSKGLHACTVNWGAWSDVGAAASIKVGLEGSLGLKAFSPAEGIAALERALRYNIPQCSAIQVSDWSIMKQFYAASNYTSEIKSDKSSGDDHSKEYQKLMDEVKAAAPEERAEKISHFLETLLRQTLRLPESEAIDPDQNFGELGVDSLMAMEMRNRLQGMLGDKTLTISALQENRTLRSLSNHLANLMNAEPSIYVPLEVQVKEDCILPEDIQAAEISPLKPSQFRNILLTGATGHLGLHVLVELCKRNVKIYCIIRGKTVEEAQERLIKALTKYEIMGTVDMDKVQVLAGDLVNLTLGFGEEDYENLSKEIDAIIHCAVKSNHIEGYSEGNKNDLRTHNVLGTVNVIRFAAHTKTKPILYASSLLAVTKVGDDGILNEDYPDEDDLGVEVRNGYTLTKFVCEKLFSQAERRGIPSMVLRYPSIFGHSVTGFLPTENNHSWFFLVSCLRARVFPKFDHNGLPIMPVDIAAQITVDLFLSDDAERGMYNLTSDSDATEQDIQDTVCEFGFTEQKFLPFSEWRDAVFQDAEHNLLQQVGYLYEDDANSAAPRYLSFHPLARTKLDHVKLDSISVKLRKNHPNIEALQIPPKIILHRHLCRHFNMTPTK